MLKQFIILLVLSILAVILHPQVAYILDTAHAFYNTVVGWLGNVFSRSSVGYALKQMLALILIPVAVSVVIGLVYWAFKRKLMRHIEWVSWIVWVIIMTLAVR